MLKYCLITISFAIWSNFLNASYFQEGIVSYKQQNWEEARRLFEKHLTTHQTDVSAMYNIGLCLLKEKKYVDAVWYFEKAYKLNPKEKDYQIQLDTCYQQLGLMKSWNPPLKFFKTKLINFSLQTWALLLLGFSVLLGAMLFLLFVLKNNKKAIFSFLIFSLGIWIFVLYAYITKESFTTGLTHAIVTEDVKSVYTSDKGNAIKELTFQAGERVELGVVGERVEVILPNKEHIWLNGEQVRLIR